MANWDAVIALVVLAIALCATLVQILCLQREQEAAVGMAPSIGQPDGLGGKESRLGEHLRDFEAHFEERLRDFEARFEERLGSLEEHVGALEQPVPAPTGGLHGGSGSSTSQQGRGGSGETSARIRI
ncbi:hypothetical protein FQN50_005432 [Emmonsiellopsis sp. PD_5]|nr:hypothetical protein FQN50_005432 [Emmonsiellopsis sp. PD_5]